jgi:hypothetical protein
VVPIAAEADELLVAVGALGSDVLGFPALAARLVRAEANVVGALESILRNRFARNLRMKPNLVKLWFVIVTLWRFKIR